MHNNAHGLSIAESNINEFIRKTDEQYKNISKEPVYIVDFIWNEKDINSKIILDIADSKNFWGQELREPLICLKDIPIGTNNVQLLSAQKNPTLKITIGKISIMKFKSSIQEYKNFIEPNTLLTIVGKANANTWNNFTTPQIIVDNFELKQEWVF